MAFVVEYVDREATRNLGYPLRMKRFGSIFPFLESGQRERHIGRLVANHDFAKAVLKHGDFDEFVFSNTSVRNLAVFMETAAGWGLPPGRLERVRCVGYADLPDVLRRTDFEVFHLGGWGWMMPGLHYVRARYAPVCWPITAVIHSLNGRDVVDHAVRLSHAALTPHDAVFCTSRDGHAAMERLLAGGARIAGRSFAGRLVRLPLGVDDELLDARGDRERGRARLKIPADAIVLLVLGRITPTQKMDLGPLCRVLARRVVPASPAPVVLLLAGSASPHDLTLAKGVITTSGMEPHVRLHANFPLKDKPDVLAMSDILVSPVDNTQETFGLSLLEAMAAGLPVVASRFDGYKDLVEDGVDGFLVDTWWSGHDPMGEWFDLMDPDIAQLFQAQGVAIDLDRLADRLLSLVGDPSRRAAMGRAGQAKVLSTYRWSRVIAAYERVWSQLRREVGSRAPEPAGENPYALGPTQTCGGYASRRLEASTRLRASAQPLDEAPYNETAPLLATPLLEAVLDAAARPTTVAGVVEAVQAPADRVMFAVRWLLKYGFLVAG